MGGNLNFYIVVQFYSILVIILLAKLFPSRYSRGAIHAVLGWYALARAAEMADQQIYVGNLVTDTRQSICSLTVGAYWILRMLRRRTPISPQRFESAMV